METLAYIFIFIFALLLDIVISAAFLWVGMKFASIYAAMPNGGQYCEFPALIKVIAATVAISYIPVIGPIASFFALFYFLKQETDASIPELLIMVIVSRVTALIVVSFVTSIF